jgi:glycosyltransferase involved in cell wall biosynthesis
MATISVCMIVKNEEKLLPRAIECFKDLADEIIITDTGSSDHTKEVAYSYTDKVYDFEWIDDFAAARNFCFSKATMDYIYSADADEIIDRQNRDRFRFLKESLIPEIDIVQMKYGNQLQNNTNYNYDCEYRPKLFKRIRTFRWIEPIHETIDTGLHVFKSDIVITHMPENVHSSRDLSVFKKIISAGPLSPRLHHLYARELFIAGNPNDFSEAYEYFESTLHDENCDPQQIKDSECVVTRCANIKNDSGALFKSALKNVIGKPSAEVCCELGDYYFKTGDYEEAAIWYYTAVYGAECELNIHCSGDYAMKGLSESYKNLGNSSEADKYSKMASGWRPPEPIE